MNARLVTEEFALRVRNHVDWMWPDMPVQEKISKMIEKELWGVSHYMAPLFLIFPEVPEAEIIAAYFTGGGRRGET